MTQNLKVAKALVIVVTILLGVYSASSVYQKSKKPNWSRT